MTTAVELLSFIPTGATTKRSLGDWTSDGFLNVLNFPGVDPTGVSDSTAGIQACLDAAFGSYASPHGNTGSDLNKPVFFPAGTYSVTSPISGRAVTGAVDDGSGVFGGGIGRVKLTVSTTGIAAGDRVTIANVGGTTEANKSWFVFSIVDSTHLTLDNVAFSHAFTSSGTLTTPALRIRDVLGGYIFGVGRESSKIISTTRGIAFHTDGFGYGKIEGIGFRGVPGDNSIAFDLNWNNNTRPNQQSTQSNSIIGCNFGGGDYGLAIGDNGFMSSETLILNCFLGNCATAGLYMGNYNALQATITGGNISYCGIGILNAYGSVPSITGVGFQGNTVDIELLNSGTPSGDGYHISSCRSESTGTFLVCGTEISRVNVAGCSLAAIGTAADMGNTSLVFTSTTIDGTGLFTSGSSAALALIGCTVLNPNFLAGYGGSAHIENLTIRSAWSLPMFRAWQYKKVGGALRTLGLEATSLTDASILYESRADDVPISNGSPAVFSLASHNLPADTAFALTTTGTLPAGLSLSKTYYVSATSLNTNDFRVSATIGGATINTSSAGSGTHTMQVVRFFAVGDQILKNNVAAGGSPGWICTTEGRAVTTSDAEGTAVFRALANVA